MRQCYSELKPQLARCLRKPCSRIHLIRHATTRSAFCFICIAGGVDHKEVASATQLAAATKGTYKLDEELATINYLVDRIIDAIDNHKSLIRFGLERGQRKASLTRGDEMPPKIDNHNFQCKLKDLEKRINQCFITINRAKALLLQEIYPHQSCNDDGSRQPWRPRRQLQVASMATATASGGLDGGGLERILDLSLRLGHNGARRSRPSSRSWPQWRSPILATVLAWVC
ncbi:hypothetical protein SO802_001737 [Lithocarpus litseifolius]|uniref:Uncharacterized protein n=1 Tax=Lithocarpus litseifolius TaxID=425828 RepID=A0AAW2DYS9_9ROSI